MVSEEGFNVGHYDSKKYTPHNDRSEYQANHDSFSTKHLPHHLLNDVWRLRVEAFDQICRMKIRQRN
jgi:hypothetical protein